LLRSLDGSHRSSVAVGAEVVRGQVVAHVAQIETEERYHSAGEVLRERERERDELATVIKRELELKSANFAGRRPHWNR
jgi:hypothetical protein